MKNFIATSIIFIVLAVSFVLVLYYEWLWGALLMLPLGVFMYWFIEHGGEKHE